MSIKLGNNKIINIYKDNKEIVKIYNGNQKIYDLFENIDYENLANNSWKAIKYIIKTEGVPEGWRGQIKNIQYYSTILPVRLVDWTEGRYILYSNINSHAVFESTKLIDRTKYRKYAAYLDDWYPSKYYEMRQVNTTYSLGYSVADYIFSDPEDSSIQVNQFMPIVYYYSDYTLSNVNACAPHCFLACAEEMNLSQNTLETNNKGCFNYYENATLDKYIKTTVSDQEQSYWLRTITSTISGKIRYFNYIDTSNSIILQQDSVDMYHYIAPCFAL